MLKLPWQLSATDIVRRINARELSAEEVTRSAFDRLEEINPATNAVVISCKDTALAKAAELDARHASGAKVGSMAGVPVTVKVNIDQHGYANTNGLQSQKDLIATANHPVVDNLEKADAIVIGRTNTPAFSMRWFTRNSLHGATLNPVNSKLTPGGSSGGAASAVASGIGAIAHGTDIAGSIRYPAYACGVHGLRPSFGRVPAYNPGLPDRYIGGQLAAVSGPLARTVDDLELALHAMSAEDYRDPWWVPAPLKQQLPPKRVALCVSMDDWVVNQDVVATLLQAADQLRDAGWDVVETDCPPMREAAKANMIFWMADMARVGREVIENENDPDALTVYEQLEHHTGTVDRDSVLDAMQTRVRLIRQWRKFLHQFPLVLCPVSSEPPFEDHLDVKSVADFDQVFEAQMIQIGLPALGLPGMSFCTGIVDKVPAGVQLIADRFREDVLIAAGRDLEKTLSA